jgi:hypothetical protein
VVLALLPACAADDRPADRSPSLRSPSPPASATPSPRPDALPAVPPWRAGPGEVAPRVKLAAAAFLEAAGTWTGDHGDAGAVARRLRVAGYSAAAAADAAVLAHDADAATLRVVYPQYGGLTASRASVMALAEQRLLVAGRTTSRRLVLDVRVSRRAGPADVVTGVAAPPPAGGPRPPGRAAKRVLANRNVVLSDTSARDVTAGRVDDALLAILDRLAATHVLDVTVLRTGHPREVFGTGRTSNHTHGRAVDIWRVDGEPVVDPGTPRALLRDVMVLAGRLGATEVGGPFDANGSGPGFFSDDVHRDHLHVGVTPGRPRARP